MKRAQVFVAAVAFVALGAASCSNNRSDAETASDLPLPEDLPLCTDLFTDGKTIVEADFGKACKTADEQLEVPLFIKLDCLDDRKLVWNKFAWGYVNSQMAVWPPDTPVKIPTDDAMLCRRSTQYPGAPADGQTEPPAGG
jgi:hypothetical protein